MADFSPKKKKMADWSLLPNDLLELIVGYFETSLEIVLFRSICKSWRSFAPLPNNTRNILGIQTHIAFNGFSFNGKPYFETYDYCTLKKKSIYLVRFETPFGDDYFLTELREKIFYDEPMLASSPLSWNNNLADRFDRPTNIFPKFFNSLAIQIIPFEHYYEISYFNWEETFDICQYLELNSKDCKDFVILVNGCMNLIMYRYRNKTWTHIVNHPNKKPGYDYRDMVAFKGSFYAVDSSGCGQVFVIEPSMEVTEISSVERGGPYKPFEEYLVKSEEELLLVQRFGRNWCYDEYMDTWFKVFRLDRRNWVEVNDLNGRVIFLGSWPNEINICCSVQKLPGAKENCIVFASRRSGIIYDNDSILLFDLKTRRTTTASSECRGCMGAFGTDLKSLVSCGVVTIPNMATGYYDEMLY